MIVASQVLHATTTIAETVQNASSLLKTGGKMVLLEITNVHLGTGLVLGTFPHYWNGISDGRNDSPLLTKSKWQAVLTQNGFSGINILLDDHADSVSLASTIITTAVEPSIPRPLASTDIPRIVFAYADFRPSFSFAFEELAIEKGIDVASYISCATDHVTLMKILNVPCTWRPYDKRNEPLYHSISLFH